VRDSGHYPLCGRGDINTYAVFAELARGLQSNTGRIGIIVPSGIATDNTTKYFFQDLVENNILIGLCDFENRSGIFPGVHRSYKFSLLTLTGMARPATEGAKFVFFAHQVEDLRDEQRRFTLSSAEIALLNPNTRTCPIFRNKRDAEITKAAYRRVPVLINESIPDGNPWKIEIGRMFHSSGDSGLFVPYGDTFERMLLLYEAKCFWQYDHRFSTYDGDYIDVDGETKLNPSFFIQTRYWILDSAIPEKYRRRMGLWYLSYRRISNATNERTIVSSIIPECGLIDSGNNIYLVDAQKACFLIANMNSFAADFFCRQAMGGTNLHLYIFQQLPILPPSTYDGTVLTQSAIQNRVLELSYTAWDLQPFAQDCGYDGPPFCWDEERRFLLRCELDAAYFHLYGIARDDVDYIMETFPIVKRKDEAAHGEYRTKRVILEIYDAMQRAIETGEPYRTLLDPPPADPQVAHPPKE
jgi:hypothetical protein